MSPRKRDKMSVLLINARPYVRFDVDKVEHRRYYADFMKNQCWKNSPVRFHLESGYGDVVSMIENKLAWYYLKLETKEDLPQRSEYWMTNR